MKRVTPMIVALFLLFCGGGKAQELKYTQIDQETAKEMMARSDGHVIVDVRRQDEYDAGHIPGAILIPNESIGCDSPEALPDYGQIILVYCRSGNRSKQAAQKLASMGYTHVYEFGGIMTWTGEIVTAEEEKAPQAAELSFSSFDGGGLEYTVEIEDASIVACTERRDYGNRNELEEGSPYRAIFTFTGLKAGSTTVKVYGRSPIIENKDAVYTAIVDEALNVTLKSQRKISTFFLCRSGDIHYDSYHITYWQDGYHVSVNDGEEQYIDAESVDALMRIIDGYELEKRDGFNEAEEFVLDGESFWLQVQLTDGASIQARGDNAFPENYFPAMALMQEALDGAAITYGIATDERPKIEEQPMKIKVSDGNHTVVYQLNNSGPAVSLYGMLPLDAQVENYGGNEKIFYPAQAVEANGGLEGGGEAGALALFSPWGNVVMYYGRFGSYPGLYILGEAVDGAEQVKDLTGMIHVEKAE